MKTHTVEKYIIEKTLLFTLSFFAVSIFFTKSGMTIFGLLSIMLLVAWRFAPNYQQKMFLPKPVVILTALFIVNIIVSAYFSENSRWAFSEISKYRHLLIAGLVFTAPIRREYRKALIVVFFLSAAFDAVIGILQYLDLYPKAYGVRPHGYSTHPILYAANLAFVSGAGLILLFIPNDMFAKAKDRYFLAVVSFLTFISIILSQSRGVWVAFGVATVAVVAIYEKRKAMKVLAVMIAVISIMFAANSTLRERAVTIVTSFYTEDESGSTGQRIELWKGALLIFSQSPATGTGFGDFEPDIKRLMNEKKIKNLAVTIYAHNIFLQVLATRGILGFLVFVSLLFFLLKWGWLEVRSRGGVGGYIIILCTLLTVVGGLSENNMEIHRFLAAFSFTIGALGPLAGDQTTAG